MTISKLEYFFLKTQYNMHFYKFDLKNINNSNI